MTQTDITIDRLRADIIAMLDDNAVSVGDEDNLIDLGLDSMRAMNLVMQWEEAGLPLDFADLAEAPTLKDLWAIVAQRMKEGSA